MTKKGHHRRFQRGFTLIEVALVLAITGMVFAAIASGIGRNISRSRYTDAVNDLSSFLQGVYNGVINVQNIRDDEIGSNAYCSLPAVSTNVSSITDFTGTSNPGRSDCALYGKLITFNESDSREPGMIHTYDVIGNINPPESDTPLEALHAANSDVISLTGSMNPCDKLAYSTSGRSEYYLPQWSVRIENPEDHDLFTGAVMIIRSPISGTIHTYAYTAPGKTFEVQSLLLESPSCDQSAVTNYNASFVSGAIENGQFDNTKNTLFCVAATDAPYGDDRRGLRIIADGKNTSAVEILPMNSEDNTCNH